MALQRVEQALLQIPLTELLVNLCPSQKDCGSAQIRKGYELISEGLRVPTGAR